MNISEHQYLTIYNREYYAKQIPEREPYRHHIQEFQNPTGEPFRIFLHTNQVPPDEEKCLENVDEYYEKYVEAHPSQKPIYFSEPLNHEIIREMLNERSVKSTYTADYSYLETDQSKLEKAQTKEFRLPENWSVPQTTYRKGYRDPVLFNKYAYKRDPSYKNTKTAFSTVKLPFKKTEYADKIGRLGDTIVKEQMFGKITHPDCKCVGLFVKDKAA